jgi:hypothetical protein
LQAKEGLKIMGLPLSFWSQTMSDNTVQSNGSPETTNFGFSIATLTPSNVADAETAMGTLAAAIAGITLGHVVQRDLVYWRQQFEKIPATSTAAQRENKWLCRYHDTVTFQKMTRTIGTADLTKLVSGSEFLVLTSGAGATLKSAFEAVVVSDFDPTHSVVLDSVQFVGRNS